MFKTSRKTKKEILEIAFVVAVIQPLMALPQALIGAGVLAYR